MISQADRFINPEEKGEKTRRTVHHFRQRQKTGFDKFLIL